MYYPPSIQLLIQEFSRLPGIGEKTAQRFVFALLRRSPEDLERFGHTLATLHDKIILCDQCFNYSEKSPCEICGDPKRDRTLLCVVSFSHDIAALERTRQYKGLYHVLGGALNILDGVTPDKLKIKQLIERITEKSIPEEQRIREVVLAFNPDLEGETTNTYLGKLISRYPAIKLTRLARGLPRGADIEYADEVTLGDAMNARREIG